MGIFLYFCAEMAQAGSVRVRVPVFFFIGTVFRAHNVSISFIPHVRLFLYRIYIMITLYLARHGETEDNAARIMQGQTQGRLNRNGIQQAFLLRDRLSAIHIDAFVASDLQRAVETAVIVAEPHGREIVCTPLLRERDWGDFTGRYIPELQGERWPDNVESMDCLQARARDFLAFVMEHYPGSTVLAVGHGIINKAVQAVHYNKPMSEIPRMDNAEVRVLEL